MQWPPTTVQRSLFYRAMRRFTFAALFLCVPAVASANGSYSHVHISQLAADGLPPGELATLLADPDNRAALEAGSMFPDSGYAIEDEYGEIAHWEPFLGALIAQLRATHGGDYASPEAQRQVAFALGVASHGIADQTYDTTLLARAYEVDGPEDDARPVDQFADRIGATHDRGPKRQERHAQEIRPMLPRCEADRPSRAERHQIRPALERCGNGAGGLHGQTVQ